MADREHESNADLSPGFAMPIATSKQHEHGTARKRRNNVIAKLVATPERVLGSIAQHSSLAAAAKALDVHRSQLSRAYSKINAGVRFSDSRTCKRGGDRARKQDPGPALQLEGNLTGQQAECSNVLLHLLVVWPHVTSSYGMQVKVVHAFISEHGDVFMDNISARHVGRLHPRFVQMLTETQAFAGIEMQCEYLHMQMQCLWGVETTHEISTWSASRVEIVHSSVRFLQQLVDIPDSTVHFHASNVHRMLVCLMPRISDSADNARDMHSEAANEVANEGASEAGMHSVQTASAECAASADALEVEGTDDIPEGFIAETPMRYF